jgi:hypothetical protein
MSTSAHTAHNSNTHPHDQTPPQISTNSRLGHPLIQHSPRQYPCTQHAQSSSRTHNHPRSHTCQHDQIKLHHLAQPHTSECLTFLFPVEILNTVLDKDTGELLEMHHLLANPNYKDVWGKSYTTELGRLTQGIPGVSKGTFTIVFITCDNIPFDQLKDITYGCICVNCWRSSLQIST